MTPRGRAVERVTKHAGETVRFRIRVTNLGTESARNVVVCDVLPKQLTLVHANVPIVYRRGRPCAVIPVFSGQRQGFLTMRIARTAKGVVTNVAAVTSRASGTRHNSASIRVPPRQGDRRRSDGLEVRAGAALLLLTALAALAAASAERRAPHAVPGAPRAVAVPRAAAAVPPRRLRAHPRIAWIARLVARTPAWDAPRAAGTPHMLEPLGRWTGGPVGLLVLEARDEWVRMLLPARPNGSSAWVKAGAGTCSCARAGASRSTSRPGVVSRCCATVAPTAQLPRGRGRARHAHATRALRDLRDRAPARPGRLPRPGSPCT